MRTVKWVDIPIAPQRPNTSGDPQGAGRPNSTKDKKEEEKTKREHKKGAAKEAKEAAAKEAAAKEAAAAAAAAEPIEDETEVKIKPGVVLPKPAKKKVSGTCQEIIESEGKV